MGLLIPGMTLDNKIYPYVYSEVSGYGISFYLYLESMREDNELLERAILSADWIHKLCLDCRHL